MKGLFCAQCVDIRLLPSRDFQVVECRCGNVKGWWIDGQRGIARYEADKRSDGFMVGLNNRMLQAIVQGAYKMDEAWREAHDEATTAPGYHFDKSRKGCWFIVLAPGLSSDTAWASDEERERVEEWL